MRVSHVWSGFVIRIYSFLHVQDRLEEGKLFVHFKNNADVDPSRALVTVMFPKVDHHNASSRRLDQLAGCWYKSKFSEEWHNSVRSLVGCYHNRISRCESLTASIGMRTGGEWSAGGETARGSSGKGRSYRHALILGGPHRARPQQHHAAQHTNVQRRTICLIRRTLPHPVLHEGARCFGFHVSSCFIIPAQCSSTCRFNLNPFCVTPAQCSLFNRCITTLQVYLKPTHTKANPSKLITSLLRLNLSLFPLLSASVSPNKNLDSRSVSSANCQS